MTDENKGYALELTDIGTRQKQEKVYLKPMSLYIPEAGAKAVAELIDGLPGAGEKGVTLTVTNKNNGVSVDKTFTSLTALTDKTTAADAVKDLINIVRGYDTDEDTNICGW
jgi:hypothetical protein